MTQPFIKLRSATEHCESHGGGVHTAAQNLNPMSVQNCRKRKEQQCAR
jgi:hypothetical protein